MSAVQFYKEENFKVVESDGFRLEVPEEWEVVRLEDLCERIKAGGTPSTSKREFWNGDIPFVKIEDITLAGKYLTNTKEKISKLGLENSSAWIVPENSLLLAMYGSLGEVTINKIPAATNQAILGIISSKCDVEFLYYWFLYFKPNWRRYAKPTTQANLTAEIVRNSKIPLPPLPEQQKIAHVLMSIDKAIEAVDEAIKQAERIKKGLMQELLTKGIGHEKFKDTEIGRIPEEWEVVRLGELVEIQSGKYFAYSEFCESGIKCLKIDNVGFGEILWETTTFLPEEYSDKYSELVLRVGDIVLALNRPIIDGKLKVGILSETDVPSILYQRVGRFIFKSEKIYRHFMFYLLMGGYFKKELSKMLIGTDQPYIRTPVLLKIKIPLPPLPEQQKIAEILSKWDEVIEVKRAKKERLERMKKKVMELLLTGKVRIKGELE